MKHTAPHLDLSGCRTLPPLDPTPPRSEPASHEAPASKAKDKTGNKTTGNRFAVLNSFVDETVASLNRAELATWLVLYRETRPDGLASASCRYLAGRIGADRRTVLRALDGLKNCGLLTVVRKGSLNRGPSAYRVHPTPKRGAT